MSKNMYLIYILLLSSLYFAVYQCIKQNIRFLQGNGYDIVCVIFYDFIKMQRILEND